MVYDPKTHKFSYIDYIIVDADFQNMYSIYDCDNWILTQNYWL